jgi:hypothetical protein
MTRELTTIMNHKCNVLLACFLIGSAACQERTPPKDAQIPCEANSDCPDGWACKSDTTEQLRCIQATGDGADLAAPELASGNIIDPAIGKDGTVFTVCFSAKEALSSTPEVKIDTGAGIETLENLETVPEICQDLQWAFTYTADQSKASSGTRALSVDLVDEALNRADGLALGSLQLDFAAPSLSGGIRQDGNFAAAGQEIAISFSLSEDVPGDLVQVNMSQGDEVRQWDRNTIAQEGYVYTFRYTVQTDSDPEGSWSIELNALDLAGNQSGSLLLGKVQVDTTAPRLDDERDIEMDTVVGPGQVATARFPIEDISDLDQVPTLVGSLSVDGEVIQSFEFSSGILDDDNMEWVFAYIQLPSVCQNTNITYDLTLAGATDLAGNTMAPVFLDNALRIDCVPPIKVAGCIYPGGETTGDPCSEDDGDWSDFRFTINDTVVISLEFNEPASGVAHIGPVTLDACAAQESTDCCRFNESRMAVECWSLVTNMGTALIPASFTATDDASNSETITIGSIAYDTDPPSLVSATISPDPAKAFEDIYVLLNFSEPIDSVFLETPGLDQPFVLVDPTEEELTPSNQSFSFVLYSETLNDGGSYEGEYDISILSATDRTGNTAEHLSVGTFVLDTVLPSLTSSCVYPANKQLGEACPDTSLDRRYKKDDIVQISLTLSEAAAVQVFLDDEELPDCSPSPGSESCCSTVGLQVECQRQIDENDGESSWIASATLTDLKGNVSDVLLNDGNEIDFDGVIPTATAVFSASTFGIGDSIGVVVSASEPVNFGPLLNGTIPLMEGLSFPPGETVGAAGTQAQWMMHVLENNPASAIYEDTIRLEDDFGNWSDDWSDDCADNICFIDVGPITIDSAYPNFELVMMDTPNNLYPHRVKSGDTVTLYVTAYDHEDEDAATIQGWIEGSYGGSEAREITCIEDTNISGAFTCSHLTAAGAPGIGDAPDGAETPATIHLEARDDVGNLRTMDLSLILDFKAPTVDTAQISYNPDNSNPFNSVPALKEGTSAILVLLLSEPGLIPCPSCETAVWADCGDTQLAFKPIEDTSEESLLFRYSYDFSGLDAASVGSVEQNCTLHVDYLQDLVGNQVSEALILEESLSDGGTHDGLLAVDTLPPDVNDLDISQVKHLRIPFGAEQIGQVGGHYLVDKQLGSTENPIDVGLPDGFFDASSVEAVSIYSAPSQVVRVGFLQEEAEYIAVSGSDAYELWLAAVDASGNESTERVRVPYGEWVGTMGINSVMDFTTSPYPRPIISDETLVPITADAQNLLASGASGAIQTAGQIRWQETNLEDRQLVVERQGFAMAYDGFRDRTVLFGGIKGDGTDPFSSNDTLWGDTWEFDGHTWTKIDDGDPNGFATPRPRFGHAMVYDGFRNRVLLFGGQRCESIPTYCARYQDTWEWNGQSWEDVSPQGSGANVPTGRAHHSMAYDAARGRTVLFGGIETSSAADALGDTWEWDGQTWAQVSGGVAEGETAPEARRYSSMAYDAARQVSVLFGGHNAIGPNFTETWAWDGSAWTMAHDGNSDGDTPSHRHSAAMAYDIMRSRIVLFGGGGSFPGGGPPYPYVYLSGDTWEWDGFIWDQVAEIHSTENPAPLYRLTPMVYETSRSRSILLGGFRPFGYHDDNWSWNGHQWKDILDSAATTGIPTERQSVAMAYDPSADPSAKKQILLFGGQEKATSAQVPPSTMADTWAYTLSSQTWTEVNNNGEPAPESRRSHAMVTDGSRAAVMLFGGRNQSGYISTYYDDLWKWDASASPEWTQILPSNGTTPGLRAHHAMVYDVARDRLILFGGSDNTATLPISTWEWDMTTQVWTEVHDGTGDAPPPRQSPAMAYDRLRDRTVLFGGEADVGDEGDPCGDGQTAGSLGACRYGDTWEWNGQSATWIRLATTDPDGILSPTARLNHAMAYDTVNDWTVLFGGQEGSPNDGSLKALGDAWIWDGNSWVKVLEENNADPLIPPPRYHHGMAFDEANSTMVLYGGYLSTDTWEWDVQTPAPPSHRIEVPVQDIIPHVDPAACVQGTGACDVETLELRAIAGASGGPQQDAGPALKVWNGLYFETLATNTADLGSPEDLAVSIVDPSEVNQFLIGDNKALYLELTPKDPGPVKALNAIETGYVEVRMQYRIPEEESAGTNTADGGVVDGGQDGGL